MYDCLKIMSIEITELFIISRSFLSTVDAHVLLLGDLLNLQRDYHSSLKFRAELRSKLVWHLRRQNLFTLNKKTVYPNDLNIPFNQSTSTPTYLILPSQQWKANTTQTSVGPDMKTSASSLSSRPIVGLQKSFSKREKRPFEKKTAYVPRKRETALDVLMKKYEEANNSFSMKYTRYEKATLSKLPEMLLLVLQEQSNLWLYYHELFEKMKDILQTNRWWNVTDEDRSIRQFRSTAKLNRSGSSSNITSANRLAYETEARNSRLEHISKWTDIARDCVTIWMQLRKLETDHAINLAKWLIYPHRNDPKPPMVNIFVHGRKSNYYYKLF